MTNYKRLIAAIGATLLGGLLTACGTDREIPPDEPAIRDDTVFKTEEYAVELIALADTEEQALEIAELYQIELLSFSEGVAVYTTDQDPQELIALGQEKGYPLLSINQTLQLH